MAVLNPWIKSVQSVTWWILFFNPSVWFSSVPSPPSSVFLYESHAVGLHCRIATPEFTQIPSIGSVITIGLSLIPLQTSHLRLLIHSDIKVFPIVNSLQHGVAKNAGASTARSDQRNPRGWSPSNGLIEYICVGMLKVFSVTTVQPSILWHSIFFHDSTPSCNGKTCWSWLDRPILMELVLIVLLFIDILNMFMIFYGYMRTNHFNDIIYFNFNELRSTVCFELKLSIETTC